MLQNSLKMTIKNRDSQPKTYISYFPGGTYAVLLNQLGSNVPYFVSTRVKHSRAELCTEVDGLSKLQQGTVFRVVLLGILDNCHNYSHFQEPSIAFNF